ncbi:uncharacterized protein MONOS_7891 [Monocercomonoides exilis]|uniref:uncharacterized protein n=1 Tax=Monocercomonoides exilis TaxID=2049356 RepID=UPI00355A6FF3|nr:hypothetical protein MONOS_7891 [Monocercomonoides exilis]|eukprot:MONOS_7891.1-p1 / transcript=MONOS_7891.1 / gene=MONOS_7891 / organism=Monocercomonoides_exilis_PA203 / gene_product=unspecified product / transcript_product=unspecified product / location=Mono_scaffold00282:44468-50305(-) / protein_length=1908 / sequence_SO=supercontig / SO=protein_coding / is_pseudo=false
MSDDSKSYSSTSSGSMIEFTQAEGLGKFDEIFFSVFSPLYNQTKHPNNFLHVSIWVFMIIQMVTLGMFRVDMTSQTVNLISSYICYPDGTSLSYLAGTYVSYITMGIYAYIVILTAYLAVVAIFYRSIAGSQPWIIDLLRWITNATFSVLFIPIVTFSITTFDCFELGGQQIHRSSNEACFSDAISLSGIIIGIIGLAYFLAVTFFLKSMIFEHHPKHGGLWSSPSGTWQAVESCMIYGCVFAMRMLYAWPFWRGVVTVGTSLGIILYFILKQPIYKLPGNILRASSWCIFGCVRLFGEIGYAIEGAIGHWVVSLSLQIFGLIVGIVLSAAVLPKIAHKIRESKYLLASTGNPLIDIHFENISTAFPNMNNPERIEPSLRFVQIDSFRSQDHLSFAEYIYTQGIKANKNNGELYYLYASFLQAYRKNYMKSQPLLRKARSLSPGFFLRFVLHCKSKECNTSEGGDANRGRMSELTSLTFVSLISKAENGYDRAVTALKEFFENITSSQPDYKSMLRLLNEIVKNESISRKSYEELLATHGQSTKVLRNYARLLLDIYHDEDSAEMILNRADLIEEDGTSMAEPAVMAGFSTDMEILSNPIEVDVPGFGKKIGTARNNDERREYRENDGANVSQSSKDDTCANTQNENEKNSKQAEGNENTAPFTNYFSNEQYKAFDAQNATTASDPQWNQQQDEGTKKGRIQNSKAIRRKRRNKKKKKKKEALLSDMSINIGTSTNDESDKQTSILICTFGTLYFMAVAALIITLVVYLTMSETYKHDLDTLREICDLSYFTARSGSLGYNYFIYDIRFNFSAQVLVDQWEPTLTRKVVVQQMLSENAERLTTMLGKVHDTTTNMEPWEVSNINTYVFSFTTKFETQPSGVVEEVIKEKIQVLKVSSMLEVIATMSQMCRYLSETDMLSRPTEPDYLNDIQYLSFNALVPVLDGAKRVIVSYYDLMNENCDQIILVFLLLVTLTIVPLTVLKMYLLIYFTLKSVKERQRAYHAMLDVPKSKMQGAIRYLLSDEDNDDYDILSQMSQMNNASKQSDSFANNEDEMWTGKSASDSAAEASEEGEMNDNSKFSANNQIASDAKFSNDNAALKAPASYTPSSNSNGRPQSSSILTFSQMPSISDENLNVQSTMLPNPVAMFPNGGSTSPQPYANGIAQPSTVPHILSSVDRSYSGISYYSQSSVDNKGMLYSRTSQPSSVRTILNVSDGSNNNNSNTGTDSNIQSARSALFPMDQSRLDTDWADRMNVMTKLSARDSGVFNEAGGYKYNNQAFGKVMDPSQMIISPNPQNLGDGQLPKLMFGSLNNQQFTNQGTDSTGFSQQLMTSQLPYNMINITPNSDLSNGLYPSSFSPDGVLIGSPQNSMGMMGMEPMIKTLPMNSEYSKYAMPSEQQANISQQSDYIQKTQKDDINQGSNRFSSLGTASRQYIYDDDEMEKEKKLGIVRNAIEDNTWEEAMEKSIEKLEIAYKQLPSPVTIRMKINIALTAVLGFVVTATLVVLVLVYETNYKSTSANIILSGMRASILFQIQYLMMNILQPIPLIRTNQSVTFPRSVNPVLYNSSHCSGMQNVSHALLVPISRYFEAVHLKCHFGNSPYGNSGDRTYDSISVNRLGTDINRHMLLEAASCYHTGISDCSQLDPYRMYGVIGTIYGLTTILARLRINVEKISKMNLSDLTPNVTEARFVMTSLRNDVVEGINQMTDSILGTGKAEVDESRAVISVVIGVFSALYIISFFANGLSWAEENRFIRSVSFKLLKLLPIDADEKDIIMMPSMKTENEKFDRSRELILDVAQQLVTAIKQFENFSVLRSMYEQLLATVMAVFAEEEKEMERLSYSGIEKHKREHLLLRQRLTFIGDHLLTKNEVATAISKKSLISLFDMHFTDEDIHFAETVFKVKEKTIE